MAFEATNDGDAQGLANGQSDLQAMVAVKQEVDTTTSLEDLQTDEQRRVLDTVAQVRKCGLDSVLSLPQLVVCGDQSAGKSSVLEALTEIPFPRNDNLCTRFATEIILRRAATNSLTIKIIPDTKRPTSEQVSIQAFQESITDFSELPRVMDAAKAVMDEDTSLSTLSKPRAFAKDVLSIEIEGPTRPQLTLVDIPGLIQTNTKEVTKADVELVAQITDQYISQPRTICLAVVSAAYDCANQKILTKVREVDPKGDRTLGVITKPDLLPSGSGSEAAFLELARNEDIFFKLGWHVLKNRKFDERDATLLERNMAEDHYFRTSNFKTLPASCVGIDTLRTRLSMLLFEHVKQELPKLRRDLEEALRESRNQLDIMGNRRTQAHECKAYLTQLSLDFYELCKAAVNGHYEGTYFTADADHAFNLASPSTVRRIRAVVQFMNVQFADNHRTTGHKYQIDTSNTHKAPTPLSLDTNDTLSPVRMNKAGALAWVRSVLVRTRGRELVGNFNPLLVGELFWEQCSHWRTLAVEYLDEVARLCSRFLDILLEDKCPKDIVSRLRASLVQDALKARYDGAMQELERIVEDVRSYPINYNHYYTDTINKRRQERQTKSLAKSIEDATTHAHLDGCQSDHSSASIDVDQVVRNHSQNIDPNMENVSCEEALDCLYAIYKVCQSLV
jgi:GTPase SAR1 family protein